MKVILSVSCILLNLVGWNAFIIPDELPSILSIIYSNIPTLKKGTDSRIGWGFRLGDRADFQMLVELGPQTNTQPLGNQGENGVNKRNTLDNLANTLYAQRQQDGKDKLKDEKVTTTSEGEQWIKKWSKTATKAEKPNSQTDYQNPKPGIAIGEIDAKSVIPDDSLLDEMQLKQNKGNIHNVLEDKRKNENKIAAKV